MCRLAYDADRDGWSAEAFHGAVDTFGAAVCILRASTPCLHERPMPCYRED